MQHTAWFVQGTHESFTEQEVKVQMHNIVKRSHVQSVLPHTR
jgi:hypothetical protein